MLCPSWYKSKHAAVPISMCRSTTWALLLTTVYSIIDQWLKKNQIGKWKWWAQFHKGFQPALFHYYLSLYSTNVAFSDNRFCNLWKIGLFQSHRFSTLRTKMHLFDWMWWHFFSILGQGASLSVHLKSRHIEKKIHNIVIFDLSTIHLSKRTR